MVGIKRFKIILGIFIPILGFFLMSHNTSAVNHAQFTSYWRSYYIQQGNNNVVNQSNFNPNLQYAHTLLEYENQNPLMPNKFLKGFSVDWDINDETQFQHKTLVVKLTVVQYSDGYGGEPKSTLKRDARTVLAVNTTSGDKFKESACTGAYADMNGNITSSFVTYTCSLSWDDFASVSNAQLTIGQTRNATVNSPNIGWVGPVANSAYNPQAGSIQAAWLNYELSGSTDPSYNQIVIISEGVQQLIELENQAVDNISNQTVSDISGAENQATTNLIGVLTGFISAFSNINATNCSMTLQFPNYAGGTRVVDICQGKEKAPRIVEIGSSLLLIGVFVPLAYILIKMIYNEIRSWTNG